jgi:cytochrome P450
MPTTNDEMSLANPANQGCPHNVWKAYERIRSEQPVFLDPITGIYVLTRYQDVRKALLDPKTFASDLGGYPPGSNKAKEEIAKVYADRGCDRVDVLQQCDAPPHRLHRSLVERAFSTERVEKAAPYIQECADELIDSFIDDGKVEFVSCYAVPLSLRVVADQLGVSRKDLGRFKELSDTAADLTDPGLSVERQIAGANALVDIQQYFAQQVARIQKEQPNDKIISGLVHAAALGGKQAEMPVLLSLMEQILIAGNETTRKSIANGMNMLTVDPQLFEQLVADRSLLPNFVEEVLRLTSPVQGLFRRVTRETEIGGVRLAEGAIVEVRYGSANQDPARFDHADQIDMNRPNPTNHLTFGAGIHLCIGNKLARAELTISFETITRRLKSVRYAEGENSVEFPKNYFSLGPSRLDIVFDRR